MSSGPDVAGRQLTSTLLQTVSRGPGFRFVTLKSRMFRGSDIWSTGTVHEMPLIGGDEVRVSFSVAPATSTARTAKT